MAGEFCGSDDGIADFGDPAEKSEAERRGNRLREAIRAAGGFSTVVAKARLSESTVGNYQNGGEMKLSNAVRLAAATGVRLEWLATGEGPRTDAEAAKTAKTAPEVPQPPPVSPLLSDRVDLQRLVQAYRAAIQVTDEAERLMQLTLRFHDVLAAQDASRTASSTADVQASPATVKTS